MGKTESWPGLRASRLQGEGRQTAHLTAAALVAPAGDRTASSENITVCIYIHTHNTLVYLHLDIQLHVYVHLFSFYFDIYFSMLVSMRNYMFMHIYTYLYIHILRFVSIYIYRERESCIYMCICMHICIYSCIYGIVTAKGLWWRLLEHWRQRPRRGPQSTRLAQLRGLMCSACDSKQLIMIVVMHQASYLGRIGTSATSRNKPSTKVSTRGHKS